MIKYSLVKRRDLRHPEQPQKFYASAQSMKTLTLEKLAKYIRYHGCAYKEGDFIAITKMLAEAAAKMLKEGYRVELNIIASFGKTGACYRYDDAYINGPMFRVCLKKASQRLNLKQVAFPLIHPSMLRRILFALIERVPECKEGFVGYGYGNCVRDTHNVYKALKGQYLIPTMVQEEEIQNIDKYKIL